MLLIENEEQTMNSLRRISIMIQNFDGETMWFNFHVQDIKKFYTNNDWVLKTVTDYIKLDDIRQIEYTVSIGEK